MLSISKKLYNEWEAAGVEYCHWKSNEHLDEGLNGLTDMDVLASKANLEICREKLKELKFLNTNPQFGSRYSDVEEWIGFDEETGKLVHLHLHYKIVTGKKHVKEYVLPFEKITLANAIKDKVEDVFIMDPNLEIIILYVRLVLKTLERKYLKALMGEFVIPKDYQLEINYLKGIIDFNKVEDYCKQIFLDDYKDIILIIKYTELDAKSFCKFSKLIRKNLKKGRLYPGAIAWTISIYSKVIIKLKVILRYKLNKKSILRKTIKNIGIDITFVGSDGAGKSTLAKDIIEWLSWKIDCESFYLGSGDHYNTLYSRFVKTINSKAKRIREKNRQVSSKQIIKEVTEKNKNSIIKKFYDIFNMFYLLNISKRAYKNLIKAKSYVNKGGVAIYDRFPQNQFLGINDGPKIRCRYEDMHNSFVFEYLARKEESYIDKCMNLQPRLVLKLLLPPEVSIQRKPDHNYEEVSKKWEIVKNLKFDKSYVLKIDATQFYESELLEVKRILWEYIIKQ